MNKKLYVIVKYNYTDGGYDAYAIDGLVFNTEAAAREYQQKNSSHCILNCGIEELTLYKQQVRDAFLNKGLSKNNGKK